MHHEKIVRSNRDSKGGLMMRSKLTPDSPHVSLLIHTGSGVTMYSRATTGGPTTKKVSLMLISSEPIFAN